MSALHIWVDVFVGVIIFAVATYILQRIAEFFGKMAAAIGELINLRSQVKELRAELAAERAQTARYEACIRAWNAGIQGFKTHSAKYQPTGYWKTLGIEPTNNRDAILKAFKARAKTAHPDKGGSAAAFQQLFEARNQALANCK